MSPATGCPHAFKTFERTQHAKETTMIIVSTIIPNVWSALQSHGPQDLNQSKSNKPKKDPMEGVHFFKPNSFNLPRRVNPDIAGGVGHCTNTSMIS